MSDPELGEPPRGSAPDTGETEGPDAFEDTSEEHSGAVDAETDLRPRFWASSASPVRRSLLKSSGGGALYLGSWQKESSSSTSRSERFVAEGVAGVVNVPDPAGTRACAWSATRLAWGASSASTSSYWTNGPAWQDTWTRHDERFELVAEGLQFEAACADAAAYFPTALLLRSGLPLPVRVFETACAGHESMSSSYWYDYEEDCGLGVVGAPFATVTGVFSGAPSGPCEHAERVILPAGSTPSAADLACSAQPNTHVCGSVSLEASDPPLAEPPVWSCYAASFSVEDVLGPLGMPGE